MPPDHAEAIAISGEELVDEQLRTLALVGGRRRAGTQQSQQLVELPIAEVLPGSACPSQLTLGACASASRATDAAVPVGQQKPSRLAAAGTAEGEVTSGSAADSHEVEASDERQAAGVREHHHID